MKVGQKVTYVGPDGVDNEAEIVALAAENGASGYKRLDLRIGEGEDAQVVEDVPNERDAGADDGDGHYWAVPE